MPEDGDGPERLELTAPGRVGGRRPRRRRPARVARRRRARAPQDRPATARSPGGRSRWCPSPAASATRVLRVRRGATSRCRRGLPPHAIHGTVLDRRLGGSSASRPSRRTSDRTGRSRGRAVQRFELGADHLTCRLELHADEPMPASIGWHPYFLRRLDGRGRAARARPRRRRDARPRRRRDRHGRDGRARTGSVGRLLHGPSPAARSCAGRASSS